MEKLGRYTLIRKIGAGGMADVWKARTEGAAGFEKLVAVKRVLPNLSVDEEFVEMFVREAKLVAGLVHPNIVQVSEFGQEDGTYFIVMEYVAGSSGSALIKQLRDKGKRLSADIAVYVAAEAARALGYAHGEGVVHRDVSPHNLLLSYKGAVKVADFGIAKVATSGTGTAMGVFKGKLRYASPEQTRMIALDGRSDLFSLGLVLFELLSGEPFFGMGRQDEIVSAIVGVNPERDARVLAIDEQPLRALLVKALQADRDKRYASATEMEQALLGLLGVEGQIAARQTLSQLLPILFREEFAADRGDSPGTGSQPAAPRPEHTPSQPIAAASAAQEEVLADATVARGSPIALRVANSARKQAKKMPVVESAGTMTMPGGPIQAPPGESAAPPPKPRPAWLVPGIAVGAIGVVVAAALGMSEVLGDGGGTATETVTPAGTQVALVPTTAAAPIATSAPLIAQPGEPPAVTRTPTPKPTPVAVKTVRPTPTKKAAPATSTPTAVAVASRTPVPASEKLGVVVPTGLLTVRADPWAEVWVDGKKLAAETPMVKKSITAGKHVVQLKNPVAGFDQSITIDIAEGQMVILDADVQARTIKRTK